MKEWRGANTWIKYKETKVTVNKYANSSDKIKMDRENGKIIYKLNKKIVVK